MIFYFNGFILRIPTAVQPMTRIEGFNYKPVAVKEVLSILYSFETSLQWAASHLTHMHDLLYIRLSEPGGCIGSHP